VTMRRAPTHEVRPGLKVALIGLGYWGPKLARNLAASQLCKELVLVDRAPERLKELEQAYPGCPTYTDVHEVLKTPDLDAVVLATPVDTHASLAEMAIRAGKSVLVEKPLATSYADGVRLVALATERKRTLMVGHTFLYSPAVQLIGRLLRNGSLGRPLYLQSSRINLGIHQPDVSVLWDLGPHDVSILLDWIEETPDRVHAIGRSTVPGKQGDVAFLSLEFPSGFIASIHLSWLAPTKVRRMTLVCSEKMVIYEDTQPEEPVKIYDRGISAVTSSDYGEDKLTYRTGDVVSPNVGSSEPLRAELEVFLERVARRELPAAAERRALDVLRVLEVAHESLQAGRPVTL